MIQKEIIRLEALDGLRGILAVTVMLSHFIGSIYGWSDDRFLIGAYLSVVYFFMMSGFVLAYAHHNVKENFLRYLLTRLSRLLPLHVLSTVMIILIFKYNSVFGGYYPNEDVFSLITIIKNIFFFNGIYWKDFYIINAPSWSISIEFWASLLVPLVFNRLNLIAKSIMVLIGLFYLILFLNSGFQQSLFIASFSMLIGTLCFDLIKLNLVKDFLNDKYINIFVFLLFLVVLIGISIENHSRRDVLYMLAFIPLLFIDFFSNKFWLKTVLSSNFFKFLGFISFPLYLLHDLIIVSNIYKTNYPMLSTLLGVLISISISYLYAKYVDIPGYKYLKSKINSNFTVNK